MRVLICGGGVIGAATAYYLAKRGAEPVIIERVGIACAASGKSGGFLALDWCDGTPLGPLARRSFELHREFADALPFDYGYRTLGTLSIVAGDHLHTANTPPSGPLHWLAEVASIRGQLGTTKTTAQVHPGQFTQALIDTAAQQGAQIRIGNATGIGLSADGSTATGVFVDDKLIEGDAVIIAMGPWSVLACAWLPLPAVYGLKGHSVVLRPDVAVSAHALFVEYRDSLGAEHAPEVFPRPDGTVYVCGLPGHDNLPIDPRDVQTDAAATETLMAMIAAFAPSLAHGDILAAQACYRPVTTDGLPMLGPVPDVQNVFVATGHNCWGILNAPASGEAMAQLVTEGVSDAVNLKPFDPARLAPGRFRAAAAE